MVDILDLNGESSLIARLIQVDGALEHHLDGLQRLKVADANTLTIVCLPGSC